MMAVDINDLSPEAQSHISALAEENDHLKKQIEKLAKIAVEDELTGLLNRRGFSRSLNSAVSYAHRYSVPACLLYIDLNEFKQINDTYGHQTGDFMLKTVGYRLQRQVRQSDIVARLGGDEFAVLLWHVNHETAQTRGAKIMDGICKPLVKISKQVETHIKASAGVTILEKNDTAETLLERADQAMYKAKRRFKSAG
ncbi:MAG: GGDEF domain-containing protein [Hyphomicrobiales bacterium]